MDWERVIERNGAALRVILAGLVAMAGLDRVDRVLTRHLRNAVLRLLRPAEAAARRLIVVAARDVTVTPGPFRPRKKSGPPIARFSCQTGVILPRGIRLDARPRGRRPHALPLIDPLPRLRPRRPPRLRGCLPRVSVPGVMPLSPLKPWFPPDPLDEVDGTRLGERFAALGAALADLQGQAVRFARWRARRDRARLMGRRHRLTPLRPGRVWGIRRPGSARPEHAVDGVARDCHFFAHDVLDRHDTS